MQLDDLVSAVRQAGSAGEPLYIEGAATKSHLGNPVPAGAGRLSVAGYRGVIDYHPEELVVRVRAGTPVAELTRVLAEHGQMLAFEPPDHGHAATIGGVIAAGLSGSRRPFVGSARDFVLGVGLVLADGCYREFGGQVMKNVAGYDVARLVCGAYGTLGVIADVSLKVLPRPALEVSRRVPLDLAAARQRVSSMLTHVSCLSASCYSDGQLTLRLSGAPDPVGQAADDVGGEMIDNSFWNDLDRQAMPGLSDTTLWRLSTDPEAPVDRPYAWMDWCFAQRWILDSGGDPRDSYDGPGHWTRYSAGPGAPFSQPSPGLMNLHRRLKQAFDPGGLFNPARMYEGL